MRFLPMPRVCSGLLFGLPLLMAGCNGHSSSLNLDYLTVTMPPSLPVGDSVVLHAVAHLADGTSRDVTSDTQWSLSDQAVAMLSNGILTAKAAGAVTVEASYIEASPVNPPPWSVAGDPENLSASAQVTAVSNSRSALKGVRANP